MDANGLMNNNFLSFLVTWHGTSLCDLSDRHSLSEELWNVIRILAACTPSNGFTAFLKGHATLVAIAGTTVLGPYHDVQVYAMHL